MERSTVREIFVGGEIYCTGDLCLVERSTVRETFVGGDIDCTGDLCGWRGRLYGRSLWVERSRTAELQQSVIITSYQRHFSRLQETHDPNTKRFKGTLIYFDTDTQ